jgi:putative transcriptional regulator
MAKMKRTYRSDIASAIHESATDLHRLGFIDKTTMRKFDASCLTPVKPLSGPQIALLRKREGVSQDVLAHYLNVSKKLVGEWEREQKKPSGPSAKLLALAEAKGLDAIA